MFFFNLNRAYFNTARMLTFSFMSASSRTICAKCSMCGRSLSLISITSPRTSPNAPMVGRLEDISLKQVSESHLPLELFQEKYSKICVNKFSSCQYLLNKSRKSHTLVLWEHHYLSPDLIGWLMHLAHSDWLIV